MADLWVIPMLMIENYTWPWIYSIQFLVHIIHLVQFVIYPRHGHPGSSVLGGNVKLFFKSWAPVDLPLSTLWKFSPHPTHPQQHLVLSNCFSFAPKGVLIDLAGVIIAIFPCTVELTTILCVYGLCKFSLLQDFWRITMLLLLFMYLFASKFLGVPYKSFVVTRVTDALPYLNMALFPMSHHVPHQWWAGVKSNAPNLSIVL